MVNVQDPRPAEFTECTVGPSSSPLRFRGRILAHAERDHGGDTLRYVLYETADGDFVGELVMVDRFTEYRRWETQEQAFLWFGDKALNAELLRQLAAGQ